MGTAGVLGRRFALPESCITCAPPAHRRTAEVWEEDTDVIQMLHEDDVAYDEKAQGYLVCAARGALWCLG